MIIFNIQQDKKLHAGICGIIAAVLGWVFILNPVLVGFIFLVPIVPMLIGAGKELYDKKKGGRFSWEDILADFIGTILGCIVVAICAIIINLGQ